MRRARLPILTVAPLLLASSAEPQTAAVLGRDNAEFAQRLHEHNYTELADGLCRTIRENNPSNNDLLEIEALSFELEVEVIRRDPDLISRKNALRSVIDRENTFLGENARHRVAEGLRSRLPNLYLEYVATLAAALEGEEDAEQRAALVQEAEEVLAEAEQSLRERIERFTAQIDEGAGNTAYAERQLQSARFSLARMDYNHALLYAEGAPEREERLEAALDGFQDFGFDYADTLQNYQGIIYQGLCHEALGLTDDALVDFEDAVALREQFLFEDGLYQVGPDEADLISGATLCRVELLSRLKQHAEAAAAAADFLETIPDALASSSGPQVLAAKARAEIGAGDVSAASASAQALVEIDPRGWAGRTGREILGGLPVVGLSPDKVLRIAETAASRADYARALDLLRRARETLPGTPDEQEIGAAAFFLAGRIYGELGRLHEASLAYDCAVELYPEGSKAPEALNAAVNAYSALAKKERSHYYTKRADERMNSLSKRYPQHPLAARASIYQGERYENENDFPGAIEFYSRIDASSPSYQEASFRMASAMHQQAKRFLQQGDKVAARPFLERAEEQYKRSIELLAQAREATLDTQVQQRLGSFWLSAQVGLATLLLDLERPAEVITALEGLEEKQDLSPDASAALWTLRIRALEAQDQIEEATRLFESVAQKSPDAPGLAGAAGVLARALDRSATELFEGDPKSTEAEYLWRKAAYYYWLSVRGALEGTAALNAEDVSEVAQRLYVIALFFNDVPEGQQTFVDWQGPPSDPELWEDAARIYERLDKQAPSYRISIELARTSAILGRIDQAEGIYARLFDQNSIVAPGGRGFDHKVIEARPELVSAYLEWGVAAHMVGVKQNDTARLDRAKEIYTRMVENSTPSVRTWWQAKYFQIKLLSDRGDYELADTAIRSVKRTTHQDFDKGQFGFQEKLKALESELAKKVFDRKK